MLLTITDYSCAETYSQHTSNKASVREIVKSLHRQMETNSDKYTSVFAKLTSASLKNTRLRVIEVHHGDSPTHCGLS